MSTPCHIIRANLNEHTRFFLFESRIFFFKVELLKHITVHIINIFIKLLLFLFKNL